MPRQKVMDDAMLSVKENKLSILIVNFNTGNLLEKCINSIYQFENHNNFEIIIVDQSSQDGSPGIIRLIAKKYANIKFILNENNTGFAKGNNAAEKISEGHYILILNPDIILTEPVIDKLINILDETNNGAVSPILVGNDGKVQYPYYQKYPTVRQFIYFHSFVSKNFKNNMELRKKFLYDEEPLKGKEALVKVTQIPCAFFFTTRKIYREFGGLNDNFFLFFEDVDISYRIGKKYNILVDCESRVIHLGGASFNINKNPEIFGNYILSMNIFFDCNYKVLSAVNLKFITLLNSFLIISIEVLKSMFNMQDRFRFKKHIHFIKLFKNHYLKF